jgi:hypothetical protein
MALGPLSNIPAAPPQAAPARDVSRAQRAFFQAALGQTAGVAAPAPAAPSAAAPREPVRAPVQSASTEPAPRSSYRPGTLLDIKI